MVQIRKGTGKELTNFWADRWGVKAGEAPMVSRVKTASSFSAQGSFGYDITNSASYINNNILIHSIKCIQTQAGEDTDEDATDHAIMEIFENLYETTLAYAYADNDITLVLADPAIFLHMPAAGRGSINGVAFEWTAKNPATTLGAGYADGATSVTLADGAAFPNAGTGTIDGVAFEWTARSGNTLTVVDLDASYDSGDAVVCLNTLVVADLNANYAVGDKVVNMSSTTAATLKLKFMINAQRRMNSNITLVFPIPMLLVKGGRVKRTASEDGPIINICYTVLDSTEDIDPNKDIFLQSYYTGGNLDDAVVTDSDVEVYGAYVNSTGTVETSGGYAGIRIKNGANSERATVYLNEMHSRGVEDEELDTSAIPMWFPYPVYLKDGFTQAASGTTAGKLKLHSTSFYRKVNAKGIDHGWT